MGVREFFLLGVVLLGAILGWKSVTKILGPLKLRLDFDMGVLDIFFMVFHTGLKIILSVLLGYIFFIIEIIKIIIARSNARKANANDTQNSSEGEHN
jgi:hypothetical protein